MEKIFSPVLNKFLDEHRLANNNGTIVFNAEVKFTNNLKSMEIPAEVHVIGLENQRINVIYLFFSGYKEINLPEMFATNEKSNIRANGKSLVIEEKSPMHGAYIVEIKPTRVETVNEAVRFVAGLPL